MRSSWIAGALIVLSAASAAAQNTAITTRAARTTCPAASPNGATRQPTTEQQQYDVVLDVPALCVDRIHLRVKNLDAHVALNAVVANLVKVQAGADVAISTVDLTVQGVQVQAELLVDLDDVASITNNVFDLIDNHPELIDQLYGTARGAIGTVGQLGQTALKPGGVVSQVVGVTGNTLKNVTLPGGVLSQTLNTAGQVVVRTLDNAGHILDRTIDASGKVIHESSAGLVTSLTGVSEAAGTAGQVVRTVRDASGALIEFTVDQAGKITNAHVTQRAGGGK